MGTIAEDAEKWGEIVRRVGKGEPIDGVYVLQDDRGVVYRDHNSKPVEPDNPIWNNEQAVMDRQRTKREKSIP